MNTEDLFKYGVTPKEGAFAGKRFIVESINKAIVFCHNADDADHKERFAHGSYDLWREPKTLFEDSDIEPTWGNLKKAMEIAGLPDDTLFAVHAPLGAFQPATMSIDRLRPIYSSEKKAYIIVE